MILLFVIIIIIFIIFTCLCFYFTSRKITEKYIEDQKTFPYTLYCARQITPPLPDKDGRITLKIPFPFSEPPVILASANGIHPYWTWAMTGVKSEYKGVTILDIKKDEFTITFCWDPKFWPTGGIECLFLSKNNDSKYNIMDMPYVIDYGYIPLNNNKVSDTRILFQTGFSSKPIIICPQADSYFTITDVDATGMTIRSNTTEIPKQWEGSMISWMAIAENPGSILKEDDVPYIIESMYVPLDKTISSMEINGVPSTINNIITHNKPFKYPPINISGCFMTQFDVATTTYSHFFKHSSTSFFREIPCLFMQMKTPGKIYYNFQTPGENPEKWYKDCKDLYYIEDCGRQVFMKPPVCPVNKVSLPSMIKLPYYPLMTTVETTRLENPEILFVTQKYLSDDISFTDSLSDNGVKLVDVSTVDITINSCNPKNPNFQSTDPNTCRIEKCSLINQPRKEYSVLIQFYDVAAGFYSYCEYTGNLLVRIKNMEIDKTLYVYTKWTQNCLQNKDFNIYFQLMSHPDQVFGPLKPGDNAGFKIGKDSDCGAFDLLCKFKNFVRVNCIPWISPVIGYIEDKIQEKTIDFDDLCINVANDAVDSCVAKLGGRHTPILNNICTKGGQKLYTVCNERILSKKDLIAPDALAKDLCSLAFDWIPQ